MTENEGSNAGAELHVVFGAGPVGLAVADELSGRGKRVRIVNRSGRAAAPEGVEVVGGDAADKAFAREASAGAAVVYFALNPPYNKWPELFPALQEGVLEGAAWAGARLVAMENVYMYGPTGGRPLTEDLPYAAETRKGEVRARMSRDLFAAHEAGKVLATAGRASDFFGPRVTDSAAGASIFGRAVSGKAAQVAGDPELAHTYTYAPDIGKGLVTLGEHEEAFGRAWHLPGPETVSTRRFVEVVFGETGGQFKMQRAPKILFRAMGLFDPAMREMVEMLYEFEEPFIVDHSAFTEAFGDHATPLEEAVRETVRWYRSQ
ncbi:NAD-dependent epimerase/dehydratase family protein [soil metagenome]